MCTIKTQIALKIVPTLLQAPRPPFRLLAPTLHFLQVKILENEI